MDPLPDAEERNCERHDQLTTRQSWRFATRRRTTLRKVRRARLRGGREPSHEQAPVQDVRSPAGLDPSLDATRRAREDFRPRRNREEIIVPGFTTQGGEELPVTEGGAIDPDGSPVAGLYTQQGGGGEGVTGGDSGVS